MAAAKKFKLQLSANNYIAVMVLVSIMAVVISLVLSRGLIAQALLNSRVIGAKSRAEKQLSDNLDAVSQLQANFQSLGSKAQLIEDSLPTTPDYPTILSQMELLVTSSGNKFGGISSGTNGSAPATVATSGGLQAYPLSLSVSGSLTSIQRLLHNIEISARPLIVTSVDLSGNTQVMSAQIQMNTYYQGQADIKPKLTEVK